MERHARHVRPVQLHLDGHGELVLAGPQRAGLVRQHLGQHRLDRTGHVDTGAAPGRLALQPSAGAQVRGHVGDVYPEPDAAVLADGGDGVVEVLGVVRVDRERGQVAQVHARVRRVGILERDLGLSVRPARVGAAQPAVEHQPLHHVTRPVRTAQLAHHVRAALARAHQHEVTGARPAALDGGPRPRPEDRLRDQEAAALLEHRDHRLVEPAGGAPTDGGAHRSSRTSSSTATGRASSRSVSGSSAARISGLMPFVEIVSPSGR